MPRKYQSEIEINGTPEEVWRIISEAEGIVSWFAPEARVTPGVGGEIWVSWGEGMEGASRIEAWEPARYKRHAHDRAKGDPNVVEYTIEPQEGGKTVLRVVNSGFGDDASFDGEFESTSRAWPLFLWLVKRAVEAHFQVCKNITVFKMAQIPRAEAWEQIRNAPELTGTKGYYDPTGIASFELGEGRNGVLAIFCEGGAKSAMLTVMCLLYDPKPGDEAAGKQLADSVASRIG